MNRIALIALLCLIASMNTVKAQTFDNFRVNSDNGAAAQYNGSVAINLQNADNAVIVWQDMRSGYSKAAFAYTIDGQVWTEALFSMPSYLSQTEPSIAADTLGNFYACMIAGDTTAQSVNDIILLRSTDGGVNWSAPMVAVNGIAGRIDIMPRIAVDNTPFGSRGFIYVTWVRYFDDPSAAHVYATQSSDNGLTFLPPIQVSDMAGLVRWPHVNIRSAFGNGDVDVCWFRTHYPGVLFDHSVTEGWTYGTDYWPIVTGADNFEINGGIVISTAPVMAADNQYGSAGFEKAYLVHLDSSNSDWNIYCTLITSFLNGGEYIDFWPPVKVNNDPGSNADQFMPAVAVDELGTIHVTFLDRRNDPNNLLYDVYYTSSSDFGATWASNMSVTNVSSDPSQPGVAGQIGDRIGIAAWGGNVIITWTDSRNGNTDIYASRIPLTGILEPPSHLPENISFGNLYPNPFNSHVEIRYFAGSVSNVSIDVIDILGSQVARIFDGYCEAGLNKLIWNGKTDVGSNVVSGLYFIRLRSDGQTLFRKAVLLK